MESEEEYVNTLTGEYGEAQQRALDMIKKRISYIEANEGACFIYDEPHKLLTAMYGNERDILHAVLCMIPVVLVIPCFFAPDLQTGVCRVTEVTLHGRKKLCRLRYVVGTVIAVATAVAVHALYFIQIFKSYEVDAEVLSYPVNSLTNLSAFGNGMSIGMYYLIIYTLKILFTVLGAFFVYGISRLIKSQTYTTLAGFIGLVIPLLAVLYDMRLLKAMYPYSAALGNMFVQEKAAMVVCAVAIVAVSVVVIRFTSKRHRV